METQNRDSWGALVSVPENVKKLISAATADVETGIVTTHRRKGHWRAVNIDCYGYNLRPLLAVVQVRESTRNKYGVQVRKSYLLCGKNENRTTFCHAVSSYKVQSAVKKDPSPQSVVRAAEAWIFGIAEKAVPSIVRQGDIAVLPVKKVPQGEKIGLKSFTIHDSHILSSSEIIIEGEKFYALHPTLIHKGEHPTKIAEGWCRLLVGREAEAWAFALKNSLEARD